MFNVKLGLGARGSERWVDNSVEVDSAAATEAIIGPPISKGSSIRGGAVRPCAPLIAGNSVCITLKPVRAVSGVG